MGHRRWCEHSPRWAAELRQSADRSHQRKPQRSSNQVLVWGSIMDVTAGFKPWRTKWGPLASSRILEQDHDYRKKKLEGVCKARKAEAAGQRTADVKKRRLVDSTEDLKNVKAMLAKINRPGQCERTMYVSQNASQSMVKTNRYRSGSETWHIVCGQVVVALPTEKKAICKRIIWSQGQQWEALKVRSALFILNHTYDILHNFKGTLLCVKGEQKLVEFILLFKCINQTDPISSLSNSLFPNTLWYSLSSTFHGDEVRNESWLLGYIATRYWPFHQCKILRQVYSTNVSI